MLLANYFFTKPTWDEQAKVVSLLVVLTDIIFHELAILLIIPTATIIPEDESKLATAMAAHSLLQVGFTIAMLSLARCMATHFLAQVGFTANILLLSRLIAAHYLM